MKYRKTSSKNHKRKTKAKAKSKAKAKTSKVTKSAQQSLSPKYILVLLSITAIALIAIYYQSILIYWQQTYHSDLFNANHFTQQQEQEETEQIPLISKEKFVDQNEMTDAAHNDALLSQSIKNIPTTSPHQTVKTQKDNEHKKLYDQPILIKQEDDKFNKTQFDTTSVTEQADTVTNIEPPEVQKNDSQLIHQPLPIVLTENNKVLFVGDSLMQGVAPYVKKMLFKQYKIESLNLSKQSTGLAYPNAFNWPKTINNNLIADPSIKLLVVFLGPNDPWDFPIKGHAKYAKFKSDLWEEQYRSRIATILNSALEHNVQVLWLAAPCMRKPKLNDGMVYLNTLYQSELKKTQQHFLTTNQLLGCTYEKYNSFLVSDKDKIKVRIDDGIHFTSAGQKILAEAIMEKIIFKKLKDNDSD
jgi:hypothetical protein